MNVDSAEYQPDAIECVRDELRSRGLWYIDSEGEEKYGIAEELSQERTERAWMLSQFKEPKMHQLRW